MSERIGRRVPAPPPVAAPRRCSKPRRQADDDRPPVWCGGRAPFRACFRRGAAPGNTASWVRANHAMLGQIGRGPPGPQTLNQRLRRGQEALDLGSSSDAQAARSPEPTPTAPRAQLRSIVRWGRCAAQSLDGLKDRRVPGCRAARCAGHCTGLYSVGSAGPGGAGWVNSCMVLYTACCAGFCDRVCARHCARHCAHHSAGRCDGGPGVGGCDGSASAARDQVVTRALIRSVDSIASPRAGSSRSTSEAANTLLRPPSFAA